MTKKDYVLIASIIKNTDFEAKNILIRNLGMAFKKDNPRFDMEKFEIASGYEYDDEPFQ